MPAKAGGGGSCTGSYWCWVGPEKELTCLNVNGGAHCQEEPEY